MAPERLLARAVAYGACARLLAPSCQGAVPEEPVRWLSRALTQLQLEQAQTHLQGFLQDARDDPEGYRSSFHALERGTVSPYEASYSGPGSSAAPPVQQLADVAGFYRAFGFEARGERPDHVAAELEFLAWLCTQEAAARLSGLAEEAEVCARARRSFLEEHVSPWLGPFRDRLRTLPRPALHRLLSVVSSLVQQDLADSTDS